MYSVVTVNMIIFSDFIPVYANGHGYANSNTNSWHHKKKTQKKNHKMKIKISNQIFVRHKCDIVLKIAWKLHINSVGGDFYAFLYIYIYI